MADRRAKNLDGPADRGSRIQGHELTDRIPSRSGVKGDEPTPQLQIFAVRARLLSPLFLRLLDNNNCLVFIAGWLHGKSPLRKREARASSVPRRWNLLAPQKGEGLAAAQTVAEQAEGAEAEQGEGGGFGNSTGG